MISSWHACGLDDSQIDFESLEAPVHRDLVAPLQTLKAVALDAGFQLGIVSGYRSFDQQLTIWNGKASGRRTLLDENAYALDVTKLSSRELLFAILRWSALPGASRHHWGSDVDVVDQAVIDAGYIPQLTVAETENGGSFAAMHTWLNTFLTGEEKAFFRPYIENNPRGVSPEPWHLSFSPLAKKYSQYLKKSALRELVKENDFLLKEDILENFDSIYHYYVEQYF